MSLRNKSGRRLGKSNPTFTNNKGQKVCPNCRRNITHPSGKCQSVNCQTILHAKIIHKRMVEEELRGSYGKNTDREHQDTISIPVWAL